MALPDEISSSAKESMDSQPHNERSISSILIIIGNPSSYLDVSLYVLAFFFLSLGFRLLGCDLAIQLCRPKRFLWWTSFNSRKILTLCEFFIQAWCSVAFVLSIFAVLELEDYWDLIFFPVWLLHYVLLADFGLSLYSFLLVGVDFFKYEMLDLAGFQRRFRGSVITGLAKVLKSI